MYIAVIANVGMCYLAACLVADAQDAPGSESDFDERASGISPGTVSESEGNSAVLAQGVCRTLDSELWIDGHKVVHVQLVVRSFISFSIPKVFHAAYTPHTNRSHHHHCCYCY